MTNEGLIRLLNDAEAFVDRHSEPWYTSGQELLQRLREAIDALQRM